MWGDVDQQVGELFGGCVGGEPLGDAGAVGLGESEHCGELTIEIDEERRMRRIQRE